MKKIKKAIKNKSIKKQTEALNKRLPLAHQNRKILSKLTLLEHHHTGKIVHHKNTSHLSLFIILLIIGLFLYASGGYARAIMQNGAVGVSLTVMGEPPKSGAIITSPKNEDKFIDSRIISVVGVCEKKTIVVISNNQSIVGSAICTEAGNFDLNISLQYGDNILSALNYDNLNQTGPVTPSIKVFLVKENMSAKQELNDPVITPILPTNPSIIPSLSAVDCSQYDAGELPIGGTPNVAVVCIPRNSLLKIDQVMGVLVWGGSPPYALMVDWNNGSLPTILSVSVPGYKKVTFNYAVPKTYKISLNLKDHLENEAIVETAIQVIDQGVDKNISVTSSANIVAELINSGWLETPVPFYLLALALTLGFWLGDIFDKKTNGFWHKKSSSC